MKKIGEIIGAFVGKSTGGIVESVGKVVDEFTISKEEKAAINQAVQNEINRNQEALIDKFNRELELYLADTANARDNNAKIQESENASWLAKNVGYLLDLIFTAAFIFMLFMIFYRQVPEQNKELFYTAFGLLGAYVGTTVQFHRGSSAGSHSKQKMLDKMSAKA